MVIAGITEEKLVKLSEGELEALVEELAAEIGKLPEGERSAARKKGLAYKAGSEFSVAGYAAFYELIFERRLPGHVVGWMEDTWEAIVEEMYLLIEAFRGSTKSTTYIAFLAFFVGHHPVRTNLVIAAGDKDANEIVDMASKIINVNPGWKECFPHVVKDEKGHWGSDSGYDVVDTRKKYDEFMRQKQKEGRASTIIGVGYKSGYLPGPHPTGVLLVDDIYNEQSTTSEREMLRIETVYNGTILPMLEPETLHILIGTPWLETDLIAMKKKVRTYKKVYTPVQMPDGSLTWPEKFTKELIEKIRETLDDEIQFFRMYLLDLSKAQGLVLRREWLKWYDHTKIGEDWITFIAIDYTSTEDPTRKNVDYFSLTVGKLLPGNIGGVVTDGFRARVDQDTAEGIVVQYALRNPYLLELGIEAIITGNEFHKLMMGNMQLFQAGIVPTALKGDWFSRPKGERFEKALAPAFKRGQMYLSDEYRLMDLDTLTPAEKVRRDYFLAFEDEWLHWRGQKMEKLHTNDTLDSTFILLYLMSKYFVARNSGNRDEILAPTNPMHKRGMKKNNPFANIGGRS